jgi:hypothetical protein
MAKLSQERLLDVLLEAINQLQKQTKKIHEASPSISKQLDRLSNETVKIDTQPIERLLAEFTDELKSNFIVPKWILVIVSVFMVCNILTILFLSLYFFNSI